MTFVEFQVTPVGSPFRYEIRGHPAAHARSLFWKLQGPLSIAECVLAPAEIVVELAQTEAFDWYRCTRGHPTLGDPVSIDVLIGALRKFKECEVCYFEL